MMIICDDAMRMKAWPVLLVVNSRITDSIGSVILSLVLSTVLFVFA